ncbi:Zinc finger, RING/FYVE/PHD-type [Artemisia annua]|uniref:RING-type E3 ubiquitin transferase n=1 Tax=Artemisia annua TaxID=35608 RepID=A0A2U1Q189_ARTAN|nr:Zinc finger, RING/FYVE/PHD-type [Artemisia annua]
MDRKFFVSKYEEPYYYTRPLPPPPATISHQSHGFNLNDKVSPSVLLIIIILAIIFFISGLLHLLVRYLMRPINIRDPDEFDNVTALQGQLQQLFHLHDSGVDQSFIDTLPVFSYKSIIGVKDPFDCAVCLCEFEGEDKLRLLPKCSHAFHMDCIDTWLLSHSTCPLCRGSLICDLNPNSCCSPIVLVLESQSSEVSREINGDFDQVNGSLSQRVNSHLSNQDFEFDKVDMVKEDENKEKVVTIKLGKFKNVESGGEGEGSSEKQKIDSRRCFSMGSYEYVMDENTSLQVPIRTQVKKQASKKSTLPISPCHRPAMSECGGDSRRDFKGFEVLGGSAIGKSKRESFSVSKIWLRGKKEKVNPMAAAIGPSSRGSFSFRFPIHRNEMKANRRANSELEIGRWENDQEIQNCQWFDSPPLEGSNTPSFAKRTLLWFMGRQPTKVVHSSSSTDV